MIYIFEIVLQFPDRLANGPFGTFLWLDKSSLRTHVAPLRLFVEQMLPLYWNSGP